MGTCATLTVGTTQSAFGKLESSYVEDGNHSRYGRGMSLDIKSNVLGQIAEEIGSIQDREGYIGLICDILAHYKS
jgi:hypothetical protein